MWGSQGWNQWALQPAMFNDVPHEQIDWAELAKQWIQMQQSQPSDAVPPAPLPPPPPVSLPPPPGHMPLMPEEFVEKPVAVPSIMKPPMPAPPAVIPEPFHSERPFVENETGPFLPKTTADNTFWSKSQWEASAAGDVDERMWPTPPVEPTTSIIGGKETFDYGHMHDNPPLAMQSIDYNHMSDFSFNQMYPTPAPVPETHYDQYWSQVNAAPAISPIFLKKERTATSLPVDEVSSHIDAAKRKQLPAWIRDGLEKMEQERLKRLEKERAAKESAEKLAKSGSLKKDLESEDPSHMALPAKSKFDSESEAEEEVENSTVKQIAPVEKPPPSPIEDFRTEEEKKLDLMRNVRRMLTEVLLSVTNSEMVSIAQEAIKKAVSKAPARQLASTTSLTSVASGLRGLASYGTESEASEAEEDQDKSDSEEELYRKIREKKKLFAVKEKKIIADLERKEREEKLEAEKLNNEKKHNKELVSTEKPNDVTSDSSNANRYSPSAPEKSSRLISEVETSEAIKRPDNMNNSSTDEKHTQIIDLEVVSPPKLPPKEESNSSDSSSSSDSDSESENKHKNKSHKEAKKKKDVSKKTLKKEKSSGKRDSKRKRSKSRDSDSSGRHKRERSRDRSDKKNKKKKKYKRSDSSSSSSNESRKKNRSSKYESSHNHRSRRSRSYDDRERKRIRSVSPYRSHRKSDSHAYSSHSHRYEDDKYHRKHRDEKKYREFRHSPSPKHSSRLPRKYRSSRSLSSESESSGKKLKKSRNR